MLAVASPRRAPSLSLSPGGIALASALCLALAACGGGSDAQYVPNGSGEEEAVCTEAAPELPASTLFQIQGQFEDVDYWDCTRPTGTDGQFAIANATGTEATVTGSTADIELEWRGPEDIRGRNLLFWLGASGGTRVRNGIVTHAGGGRGYYRHVIDDDRNPMNLQFVMAADGHGDEYQLNFAIDETIGDPIEPVVGSVAHHPLFLIEVGSGDIQINLNWTKHVDLDLHVTDPTGFEIYFGDLEAPSGGMLDLDSYPACQIDGDRGRGNENVFWPIDAAPSGTYLVEVHMWSDCGTYAAGEITEYRATIVHGGEIEVVHGRFDPATDGVSTDPTYADRQTHELARFVF